MSDENIQNLLRRYMQTGDPMDAVAFTNAYLRTVEVLMPRKGPLTRAQMDRAAQIALNENEDNIYIDEVIALSPSEDIISLLPSSEYDDFLDILAGKILGENNRGMLESALIG